LVKLVNEELGLGQSTIQESLDTMDKQAGEIRARLNRMYDVLETGKLELDDIAPRIKELKHQLDELGIARVHREAELVVEEANYTVNYDMVQSYVDELQEVLAGESPAECKSMLKSFIKQITVTGEDVTIEYRLPLPGSGPLSSKTVVPIETFGRPCRSRTCDTLIKRYRPFVPPGDIE